MKRFLPILMSIILILSALPRTASLDISVPDEDDYLAYGVDLSLWNGDVDFSVLKNNNISFVILRVGYTGTKDAIFERYYEEATNAGFDIGCYIYSYAQNTDDAEEDAYNVIEWIKGKTFTYPIFYDIESDSQLHMTNDERTALCTTFIEILTENGYLAGTYANLNWYTHYLDLEVLKKYPIWLAKWSNDSFEDIKKDWPMWQYTDDGHFEGMEKKHFDLDVSFFNYPKYITENGLNRYVGDNVDLNLPFEDVHTDDWFYESVKKVYSKKLFSGTSQTTFSPDIPMTRGMFIAVVGRMYETDKVILATGKFDDVPNDAYYAQHVYWAKSHGIISGVSDRLFAPDEYITREQMCAVIKRYMDYCGIRSTGEDDISFADEDEISDYAKDAVKTLAGAHIISGMGNGIFAPKEKLTRAQCATVIKNLT